MEVLKGTDLALKPAYGLLIFRRCFDQSFRHPCRIPVERYPAAVIDQCVKRIPDDYRVVLAQCAHFFPNPVLGQFLTGTRKPVDSAFNGISFSFPGS